MEILNRIFLILVLLTSHNPLTAQMQSQSQDLNVTVSGDIYEYATYYVSSFDISNGSTNVLIFRYVLSSDVYPIFVTVRFKASMISPGLGIDNETTIVEILTDPFQIGAGLVFDNRDLSADATTIQDMAGNQIELTGSLEDVLDPMTAEAIMQTILTSGKLSDG